MIIDYYTHYIEAIETEEAIDIQILIDIAVILDYTLIHITITHIEYAQAGQATLSHRLSHSCITDYWLAELSFLK